MQKGVAEGPLQALGWSGRHPDNVHTGVRMEQKSPSASPEGGKQAEQFQSVLGCLTQLAWNLGGFGVLVILWVTILRKHPWTFTLWDALYWAAVLGMIAARYVDVVRYDGRTTAGKPATARDVRLYALGLLVVSGLLWCTAQAIHV